jgi:hypothetical protein
MEQLELPKSDPRIAQFFRSYKGRRAIKISTRTTYQISSYWDGGSRDYPELYTLDGLRLTLQQMGYEQQANNNPFNQQMGQVTINPGQVVAVQSVFMGKTGTPHLYCHPDDLPKFK